MAGIIILDSGIIILNSFNVSSSYREISFLIS